MYHIYPLVLLPLIRKGVLRKQDTTDLKKIREILARRVRFAVKNMEWDVAIELEFAEAAGKAWKEGDRSIAIVLLAVALEQCINGSLRVVLEAKGNRRDLVTPVIRSHNIEPKLELLQMHSGRSIPASLRKRASKVFGIRNSIVHYKAVPGHPDREDDSYSKIEKEIAALGRFRVNAFFGSFQEFCLREVRRCDPAIDLALNIREQLFPHDSIAELD